MAAYNIYAQQLSELCHGYPLWFPEPCMYDEVTVGDVGYVREGVFHRLFNATRASDHPSNALYGVPEGFVQLQLPQGSIRRFEKLLDPGAPLYSQSVSKIGIAASATGPGSPTVAGANLQFSCSSNRGAILVLTRRTDREDVMSSCERASKSTFELISGAGISL
ncbi:hypothetical protein SERLA73DRAFT_143743 [Serpula lacrymans var. lacrymans S7.3]|uniref:Uncharacterized protein n=1 Tax=Serpula lacrymans var. lacrymans (strain S7.3) TaxID=936435 RepID=F8Q9U9_SERL3|nr:hypothetical protein SERLA73DRAFT_143743 [Serpula lacrymans var. lacrymans S7.3]